MQYPLLLELHKPEVVPHTQPLLLLYAVHLQLTRQSLYLLYWSVLGLAAHRPLQLQEYYRIAML
jgi:hypothetical protein